MPWTVRERGEERRVRCVCVDGGKEGVMKNERMRRLGKLPQQQRSHNDNKEGGRGGEGK